MKKLLPALALTIACAIAFQTQNTFANSNRPDDKPGNKVIASLQQDYPLAGQVQWVRNGTEFIAKFNSDAGKVTATYDKKGNHLSTFIRSDGKHIPFTIQTELNKKYPGYIAQDMTEYLSKREHSYYILLKNKTDKDVKWMRVKCNGTGDIQVLQKLQQTV